MKLTLLPLLTTLLTLSAAAALPNKRGLGSDLLSSFESDESAAAAEAATIVGDVASEFGRLFG